MKNAKELYPDAWKEEQDYGNFYGPCDYQPMLSEFGEILIQVDDEDYQGDSRVFYRDGDRYGYLNFGWGSCSGCDALQACSRIKEVQELMDDLQNSIKWFGSRAAALDYFKNRDWEGDYSWHEDETKKFVKEVIEHLERN